MYTIKDNLIFLHVKRLTNSIKKKKKYPIASRNWLHERFLTYSFNIAEDEEYVPSTKKQRKEHQLPKPPQCKFSVNLLSIGFNCYPFAHEESPH